jgi:hypothetical protein
VLPVLKYTVMRLALFVGSLALAALLGAGPLVSIALAAVVSAALSYLFLRHPRDAVAQVIQQRVERRLDRPGRFVQGIRDDQAIEDAVAQGPPVAESRPVAEGHPVAEGRAEPEAGPPPVR